MKRRLSFLLAVVILISSVSVLSVSVSASAPAVAPTEGDAYPFVLIRGVDFMGLYHNYGTPEQEPAVNIDAAAIAAGVFRAAATRLITGNGEKAVDELLTVADSILGKLAFNPDGTSKYDIDLPRYPLSAQAYGERFTTQGGTMNEEGMVKTAVERYGAGAVYYFTYDWRQNQLEVADDINAMINRALAENNVSKVNIVACSMGGVETLAYMTKYGYDKINQCVFLSSTFYGTYIVSDAFAGRLTTSGERLYLFASGYARDNRLLGFAVKALNTVGIFDAVAGFLNGFVGKYQEKVFDDFLRDSFGTLPAFWALVQPEDYPAAMDYMFGGREDEYATIITAANNLQAMMRGRNALLTSAEAAGVKFTVIAAYNTPAPPIFERAYTDSDGGLETALVSGGATVADYGTTLPADYVAANPALLSPDRIIDSSTCSFPMTTWFLKNGPHVGCSYATGSSDFLFWIIDSNGAATVFSNSQYPPFMLCGPDLSLSPVPAG